MPNLLNFIRSNGTFLTNDHTVLISHTANGILTNLTGVYSDRHGQAVANSYRYFKADGSTASSSSFKYWTDLVDDTGIPPADPLSNMVTADPLSGMPKNTPAPWVPYTPLAGFGAVALQFILETSAGQTVTTKVFGSSSPSSSKRAANAATADPAARRLSQTALSAWRSTAPGRWHVDGNSTQADLLPDEPGGYNGFLGLFSQMRQPRQSLAE
jgi:hypothetical protein